MSIVQKPAVGRIVHYTSASFGTDYPEGITHAAIVIGLASDGNPYLEVLRSPLGDAPCNWDSYGPDGGGIPFAETPTPGHWSWPPRI